MAPRLIRTADKCEIRARVIYPKQETYASLIEKQIIRRAFLDFVRLAGLMVLVTIIVSLDTMVLNQPVSEYSVTEITQAILILFCALAFAAGARGQPSSRGFLVLVAGFFGTMFIRECDAYLDKIQQGFWVIPATLLTALSITYAWRYKHTLLNSMAEFAESKHFAYISFGLVILFFFSRIFGSEYIWTSVMGDNYQNAVKETVQEGIELLGYTLIAYGTWMFVRQGDGLFKRYSENKENKHPFP